jgi:DNA-binding winged helix-turn-helix (wHTH) protein/tetratricopeptide (TPR) repeat protein
MPDQDELLRFGAFELNVTLRELRRSGMKLSIQRQPFEVLAALARRPGELVTRAELKSVLWGDDVHVDFDRGLNFCMAQVRRVLDDSRRAPRFIETVPRAGYRFVAPVTRSAHAKVMAPDSRAVDAPRLAAPREARTRRPIVRWAALATYLLLAHADSPSLDRSVERAAPSDPPASYVKGIYLLRRGLPDLPVAIGLLERSAGEDPRYLPALLALAAAYDEAAAARVRVPAEILPRLRETATAALALDATSAQARTWYGVALLYGDRNWIEGGRQLRQAIALDERLPTARRAYARYLAATGDLAGAVREIDVARRLDPLCVTVSAEAAWYRYAARWYGAAMAASTASLAGVDDSRPHEILFDIHLLQGRPREAAREALAVMAIVGVPAATRARLARHEPDEIGRAFLRGALAHLRRRADTPPERLAVLHAALGQQKEAFALLDTACAEHSPGLPAALQDPLLDPLRHEEAFGAVRRCAGLPA